MYFRQAFTLIELLVVIAIIVTLMGLLLSVVNTTQAEIANTMSAVKQVEGSLNMYKLSNGSAYPLESILSSEFSDTDPAVIASRNHELRARLVAVGAEYDVGGEFYRDTNLGYLAPTPSVLSPTPGTSICIVDAWNMPLLYKPYTAYLAKPGFVSGTYKPPKPRSYQIWSAGPNETYELTSAGDYAYIEGSHVQFSQDTDATNYVYVDDISNWSKIQN